MIELQELGEREFQLLVRLLLVREGAQITSGERAGGVGSSYYEAARPGRGTTLVDVKHVRLPLGRATLAEFVERLDRFSLHEPAATGLLVTSGKLGASARALAAEHPIRLEVWDRVRLEALVTSYDDLEELFREHAYDRKAFREYIEPLLRIAETDEHSQLLSAALRSIPCGHSGWKEYERVCTKILTHVFTPELGPPIVQSRSDDRLDVLDAVFPIQSHGSHWGRVRSEYRTLFVVAEFKNLCGPIGQTEVESIAQYLWLPAQRFFGLLISREAPNASAVLQRRRKWLEDGKCIVFLENKDLLDMLNLHDLRKDPFEIIDAHLTAFFRTLTP